MHDGLDAVAGETLVCDFSQRVANRLLHRGDVRVRHALQTHREGGLAARRAVTRTRGESRTQAGLEKGLVEIRLRAREQQIGRDGEREIIQIGTRVLDLVHHQVRHGDHSLFVLVLHDRLGGDGNLHLEGFRHASLVRDLEGRDIDGVESTERERLRLLQRGFQGEVAVCEETRVGRMVMRGVESTEIVVGEVRDVDRVAAAVVVVGGGGEEGRAQSSVESSGLRTHRALHLVEHDALDCELGRGIVHLRELEAVALLQEILSRELGEKGGVEVDAEEVVVVGLVHGREGIARVVGGGHGVHERAEGTTEHVEEGVADWVFLATT